MSNPVQPSTSAEQTRLALVRAGLRLFGNQGFDGTSTRQIATEAKANIGSIAYHFGGKEGLRSACAEHIATTMQSMSAQVLAAAPDTSALTPEAARSLLSHLVGTMVHFLVGRPESGDFVQFILRELAHPTSALDIVYDRLFEPLHKRLCEVWAAATGDQAENPSTRLAVFTLIGQVVYFRIGREAVLRRMEWKTIGAAEADAIIAVVSRNLDAMVAVRRADAPTAEEQRS
jgi:AcrR family transcriptional regulator